MKKIIALVIALMLGLTSVVLADATDDVKKRNDETRKKFDIPDIPVKIPETKPVEKSTDTIKSPPQDKSKDKKSSHEVDPLCLTAMAGSVGYGANCIEKGRQCTLNGTPCCDPFTCQGKFPNTYCQ